MNNQALLFSQMKKNNSRIPGQATDLIGNTPMIRLKHPVGASGSAAVFAKLECYNPGGSIKDRIALSMVEAAEQSGRLKEGATIIEPTSGNTGIGLALVGAIKGYRVILVMTESMNEERRMFLKNFGAETVLSRAELGMQGSVDLAEEIAAQNPDYFMPQQFNNPANPAIHRRTTALEILETMGEAPIHAFVAGVGTGGTLTGIGEVLKEKYPDILVVAVEPEASPVLSGGHPGGHKIQGIGAGFIPKILNRKIIDEVITVTDDQAYRASIRLAKEQGLTMGISSGAAYSASEALARRLGPDKNIVTIFPDGGERYVYYQKYFN